MKAPNTLTRATPAPLGQGVAARVLRAVAHAAMLVLFMRRIARTLAQIEALFDLWRTGSLPLQTPPSQSHAAAPIPSRTVKDPRLTCFLCVVRQARQGSAP